MATYKVVEQKQLGFLFRIRPKHLEETINTWAKKGWVLDRVVDTVRQRFILRDRHVFFCIFRHD